MMKITPNILEEICKWKKKGLSISDISKIVGISYASVKNYDRIMDDIFNGRDYCINPKYISTSLLSAFCEKRGISLTNNIYSEPEKKEEQLVIEEPNISADELEEIREKLISSINALVDYIGRMT